MEIIRLFFDDKWNMILHIHPILYLVLSILLLAFLAYSNKLLFAKNIEIDSAKLGFKGQNITIKPNYTNINMAYKLWLELSTRKIGIKIDFEHDVILGIYKSWYEFFKITRDLLKELPANKIRTDKDAKALVDLSVKVLNIGLRPHLTKWQAKYHKWHKEQEHTKGKTPQQLQQDFPEYDELIRDMLQVNSKIIKYKEEAYKLAFGTDK